MPTYTVRFYEGDPTTFGFLMSGTFTYSGPASTTIEAIITDTQAGAQGLTLEQGSTETATAHVIDLTGVRADASGIRVSAVQSYTLYDPVADLEFEVIKLRVRGVEDLSGSDYTLSEFPLVPSRSHDVRAYDATPSTASGDPVFSYAEYVCLAAGTLIRTPQGARPVEALVPGDLVETLDAGLQPLVWTGHRRLDFPAGPHPHKPIVLSDGGLGPGVPSRPLTVSPQHRIHLPVAGDAGGRLCAAKAFAQLRGVRVAGCKRTVAYHSFAFRSHAPVWAEDALVESFYPGRVGMRLLSPADRQRFEALFPGVSTDPEQVYGPPVRPILTVRQGRHLLAGVLRPGAPPTPLRPPPPRQSRGRLCATNPTAGRGMVQRAPVSVAGQPQPPG